MRKPVSSGRQETELFQVLTILLGPCPPDRRGAQAKQMTTAFSGCGAAAVPHENWRSFQQ